MRILITGAGSVMGQSIYRALCLHPFAQPTDVHFANSIPLAAGFHLKNTLPITATPLFPEAKEDGYLAFLEDYIATHGIDVVFTGTQHELSKIALLRDQTYKAATVSSVITEICLNKIKTAATLIPHGVRLAPTLSAVDYVQRDDEWGTVIVKPNYSSASRNIFKFSTKQLVKTTFAEHKLDLHQYVVQPFLQGEEFTCGCYLDRYSQAINLICFKRTLTADGATHYGEIVFDTNINHYVRSIAEALMQHGYDFGHVNIQFIVDKEGPCLFEINGRLSSTEAPKAYYGFNACAAFITNIVEKKPYVMPPIPTSGKFLRYYEEVFFS